jgi:large subunit ribosomal protein L25
VAEVGLKAEVRTGTGKGVARKLRAEGKVPAVLYGRGMDAQALTVDARALTHSLATDAGSNVLIDLQVAGGDTHLTLARSVERHPLRGGILHVDFLKIARDQKIAVDIPIHIEGDSRGVKEGGLLEHHLWQVHVECLPGNVPERIHVDVSALAIGEVLHISDLTPPEGVVFLTSDDEIIVACVVPQAVSLEPQIGEVAEGEAAAAAGGEAAAEGASAEGGTQES